MAYRTDANSPLCKPAKSPLVKVQLGGASQRPKSLGPWLAWAASCLVAICLMATGCLNSGPDKPPGIANQSAKPGKPNGIRPAAYQDRAADNAPIPVPKASRPQVVKVPPALQPAPSIPATQPSAAPKPNDNHARKPTPPELYQQAVKSFAGIDSYIARLQRHEAVNGKLQPQEIMLFKFRKTPWSVYFKWLGKAGHGREVVYVKGRYDSKLHTKLAAGDVALLPAGTVFSLAPDSFLVRSKSRHAITEAGIGQLIAKFGKLVKQRPNTLQSQGLQQRPEFTKPVEVVLQKVLPQAEPELASGGTRHWFFDTTNHLPVLIITKDSTGKLAEYYCYDRIQFPVDLDDGDFDPARLWPKKKGSATK